MSQELRGDTDLVQRAVLEEDSFDVREMLPLVEQVTSKEGWDDPEMSEYDALDPRRPPQTS